MDTDNILAQRPESRADWLQIRRGFVGASECAALLASHPYMTAYELWARKRGLLPDIMETPAMLWGSLLEDDVLAVVARERPEWTIAPNVIPGGVMLTDNVSHLAATPDAFATDPERGKGIIQVKTTNPRTFKRTWRDADGEVTVPLWIALQANVEAYLAGAAWADVAVMVVGDYSNHKVEIVNVALDPALVERLRSEAVRFIDMVETGRAPDPDYNSDLALIKHISRETPTDPEPLDLSGDNELIGALSTYVEIGDDIKAMVKAREAHEALIRQRIGAHETATAGRYRISNKLIDRKGYTVEPTTYRGLRITERND